MSEAPDEERIRQKEEQLVIDVHPPHETAHSWRDILIHLATITIGLFIALSLEGCVEWQHHRHLVHEARANIRSEIEDNLKDVTDALDDIHKEQKQIQDDMATFASIEKDPRQHASITFTFTATTLQHASWDTARETGAISYMPYAEVKSYAEIEDEQQNFAHHMERLIDTYTPAIAFLYQFKDASQPNSSDLEAKGSKESAPSASIAKSAPEGRRIALGIQSELLVCNNIAEGLQKQYKDVLSRTPR